MSTFIDRLKAQAEENPIGAVAVTALAAKALSTLMDANTRRVNSKTWDREVHRRSSKSR